jgi:mannose-6-phosphate isomerase-like protein (cupin superfamily)
MDMGSEQPSNVSDSQPRLQPRIVTTEEGETIRPFGLEMKVLLSSEDTGGSFSALYVVHQPGEGPPPHMHYNQEEYFFVIEGTYEMTVGDTTQTAGPGTMVFIPPHTVHTFKNVGDTPAKQLDWTLPGGQDRYFREIDAMVKGGAGFGPEMMERVKETNARFDTHFPE